MNEAQVLSAGLATFTKRIEHVLHEAFVDRGYSVDDHINCLESAIEPCRAKLR